MKVFCQNCNEEFEAYRNHNYACSEVCQFILKKKQDAERSDEWRRLLLIDAKNFAQMNGVSLEVATMIILKTGVIVK